MSAASTPFDGDTVAVMPAGLSRISGELLRRVLLREVPVPADCPLKLSSWGARLERAFVDDKLDLTAVSFSLPISFEGCVFAESISLCEATLGSVSFVGGKAVRIDAQGARIDGDLSLKGITLQNPGGFALYAEDLRVRGSVVFSDSFVAEGAVDLQRMKAGGALIVRQAQFRNPASQSANEALLAPGVAALHLTSARIGALVYLGPEVLIEGFVAAAGMRVENAFVIWNGVSVTAGRATLSGMSFMNATFGDVLVITGIKRYEGTFSLQGATTTAIAEDCTLWRDPATGAIRENTSIELDGLTYKSFLQPIDAPLDISWQTRLKWLKMQRRESWTSDFHPQPFTQCAEVLRKMGNTHDASMLLFERERLRLSSRNVGFWDKIGGRLLGIFAGYGYRTQRALYWAVGVWLVGAVVFGLASQLGQMRPASEHVIVEAEYQDTGKIPRDYEPLKPALYSLDLLLPIVEIGQERFWLPRDPGERTPNAAAALPHLPSWTTRAVDWLIGGWLPKAYYYFEIAMGWVLITTALAGFSGHLRRGGEE